MFDFLQWIQNDFKEPKRCPDLADWGKGNFFSVFLISWSALHLFLKFRPLQAGSCVVAQRFDRRQIPPKSEYKGSKNRILLSRNVNGDFKRRTKDCLPLWLENLCFHMLDQKYGLGRKHSVLPWLLRCNSFHLDGDNDDVRERTWIYKEGPLVSGGILHILPISKPYNWGHFSSDKHWNYQIFLEVLGIDSGLAASLKCTVYNTAWGQWMTGVRDCWALITI